MTTDSNKILKILLAVEFILITLAILLSLADSKKIPTAYAVKENSNGNTDFKIFTKAVCEELSEHLFCRDKLFIKCDDKEYLVDEAYIENFSKCGTKLNLSEYKVSGSGVFKK